ncbi:DNA polymerase III, epsilon subunit [Xylanibacter ruminicola]|uniref:3'-5' exonuclease n=1 Tax=Xylanibacter ruminicola TaxID=839 RepID=UPI0008EA212D|nr:3'-5' exonuclease [Xylanibacter ruminicola]SFC77332.1 DNA polymerase III, epsilon subunit [Xylanibacter ruminicola]
MRILVFDTETSGLNPQWNVILQLSYQVVDSDSWTTQKTVNHYFAWPEDKSRVTWEAINVNGLTEEVLSSKQLSNRKVALEEFVKDKDSCDLLVAHNLEFDKKFIIAACREEGVKFASSGWSKSYDTMKRTTSFCQIPKDWGSGYKWPKLTELADCLYIDYSNIALHDSSGDVELTKLCFEGIVANGLYSIPKESGITMTLHVESPDDLRFEISKDGEPIDELFLTGIYGVTKKQLNIARQDLIKKWSEENDEERKDLIQIYRKSPKIKSEEDFIAEIASIKPSQYVRKAFDEPAPSKEQIQEDLETEAEHEVSSWMFWSLKKKRKEYVEERLEPYYQRQIEEYNRKLAQHEDSENKAEKEYNLQSLKRCEERKQQLTALIEGSNAELLEKEMLRVPDVMSLSFPYNVEATLNGTTISLSLSLPQPKDLPHMEGVRLASGNYKIKEIPDKNKKMDYSNWVWGISFYVAAYYFNISPKIEYVTVEGHVKTEDLNNLSLYNMVIDRDKYSSLNLGEVEIDAVLSIFNVTNKLTKDVLAKLFVTKEKEPKPKTNDEISLTNDPRFTKEAIDIWSLTSPLTDFEDKYEIWEANFYTVFETLGDDFKGSIFGYVEAKVNEGYSVEYASGRYKLTAFTPQGEPIQQLDAIADKFVQWVGIHRCPFVGYVYKKDKTSLPEGIAWIIAPISRDQVLTCASAFYKRRKKRNEIPNIIDLPTYYESSNSIGEITDSASFVPLRKRMMEGKIRPSATKKRIEEYRTTAPELTNEKLVEAIKNKYKDFFTDNEAVAVEAIKETYRNELPLTLENVMQQLGYLIEDRALLHYYSALQHIYSPKAQ